MASAEAHVSISRAISVMGLPPDSILNIPTDDEGRVIVSSLKEQFYSYKSKGKQCFAVIATAVSVIVSSFRIQVASIYNFFCLV